MSTGQPLISIVIPMRNAEDYIDLTLRSILASSYPFLEVIIVNDGSTDHSLEKIQAIADQRVKVIEGPGQGIAAALNVGITQIRGEIVMRCDADDLYPPERIEYQVNWLIQHPDYGAVCGNYYTIDAQGDLIIEYQCGDAETNITQELRAGQVRTHLCTYAIRANCLKKVGFRTYFKTAEDIDFQLRLGECCQVAYLPQLLYAYRIHDTSITHRRSQAERQFFDLMVRELQKQRLTHGVDDIERGQPPPVPECNQGPWTAQQHIQLLLISRSWREHQSGHRLQAFKTSLRSIQVKPKSFKAWWNALAIVLESPKPELDT